ncbi:MAG: hypothetical protein RIM84_07860 [Alphaproteobacteria bacterium]
MPELTLILAMGLTLLFAIVPTRRTQRLVQFVMLLAFAMFFTLTA